MLGPTKCAGGVFRAQLAGTVKVLRCQIGILAASRSCSRLLPNATSVASMAHWSRRFLESKTSACSLAGVQQGRLGEGMSHGQQLPTH